MINERSISFAKYSGTGNDFILIDNRNKFLKGKRLYKFTRLACELKTGIGADGVILLEESRKADFKMRIINADGSEPEMCGNGARCIVHFSNVINCVGKKMVFETLAGLITGEVKNNNNVKVKLTIPSGFKRDIKIKYKNTQQNLYFINTGVPHVVIFIKNIEKADVFNIGRFIRYHRLFQPAGTNVNFVRIKDQHSIYVRTYERGVENEILACGTGATAAAIVSSLLKKTKPPVKLITRSNETLKAYFKIIDNENIKDVFLEGKVTPIFSGITEFDGKKLFVE